MIISVIAVNMVQASIMDEIHVRAVLHFYVLFTFMVMRVVIRSDDF